MTFTRADHATTTLPSIGVTAGLTTDIGTIALAYATGGLHGVVELGDGASPAGVVVTASHEAGAVVTTVTDATGASSTAVISIAQPQPPALTAEVQSPASTGNNDGKATAKAAGGSGAFQYKWDNGKTAAAAVKLPPGRHNVTATDANGCTAWSSSATARARRASW